MTLTSSVANHKDVLRYFEADETQWGTPSVVLSRWYTSIRAAKKDIQNLKTGGWIINDVYPMRWGNEGLFQVTATFLARRAPVT